MDGWASPNRWPLGQMAGALLLLLAGATSAAADPRSQALIARASDELRNLDRERAVATFREAITADPTDPAAHRGLAAALWMIASFSRGALSVDHYLGRIKADNVKLPPPPEELERDFQAASEQAAARARQRLAVNLDDADAHYQLGAAIGLQASYAATVRGSVRASLGAARQAFKTHERVLALDPTRHDAGLVLGTYRYFVSSLGRPMRWMAYLAGFRGGRERGLRLVEEAAAYPGDNQVDARLALVILYNRERRYVEALEPLAILRESYPRNRLLWIETGATFLRAGMAADAERYLSEGIAHFATDARPRMFGEEALWYYKRGAARVLLDRAAEAEADLERALSSEGREWIHGRTHLELGRLALKAGDQSYAKTELEQAIALCEQDNDKAGVSEAKRLLD